MFDWPLLRGPVPSVVVILGAVSCIYLLAARGRRGWWSRTVPIVVMIGVVVSVIADKVIDHVLYSASVPVEVLAWIGLGAGAIALGVARAWRATWWQRGVVVVTVLVVVAMAANSVNRYYGEFPTFRAALGLPAAGEVAFKSVSAVVEQPQLPVSGRALDQDWTPTVRPPAKGVVTQVYIPGKVSRFTVTRRAYIYLPPAYSDPRRPLLPVLVLLHGIPGSPSDWLTAGGLAATMNRFAAAHRGLAPVVVMPDATGSLLGDPMCMDSRLGNSASYLAVDVPLWIRRHLQVDDDSRRWAIAGLSYGGTCAWQLALRRPATYPTFIDLSGEVEPSLATRAQTIRVAFNGNAAAYTRATPLYMLAAAPHPSVAGIIGLGRADTTFGPQQRLVYAACRRVGIDVRLLVLPGAHTWQVWSVGLRRSLPWLAYRLGITAP